MTLERVGRRRRLGRWMRRATMLAGAVAAAVPAAAGAQTSTPWRYEQDLHVSYEFDDNVGEQLRDPVRAQVAKLSYRGDFQWGGGEQRLSLAYYGGFKRHFGLVNRELDVSSQFVNEGIVSYVRRVTDDLAISAQLGMKDRLWTDSDFFFINEDAFRRYSGEVGVILNLDPIDPDRPARLEASARYADIDFRNLDRHFGNYLVGGRVSLAKRFDETLEARWMYSVDRVRYPGRGALTPEDEDPTAILGVGRERQEDHIHELGTEVEWFGPVGIVADYRFRYNDSNSFGFTYFSHNLGLQVLRQLPWGLFAQLYGQVELRSFTGPVPNLTAGSLDIGEAENNVFLLRLVKDVTPSYSVEARYARYRNESITLNDFYTKNIYAVGFTYHP